MVFVPYLIKIFLATLVSFLTTMALTPVFTNFLYKNKLGKQIREYDVSGKQATIFRKLHLAKAGTPTMGGILIWGVTAILTLPLALSTSPDDPLRGFIWLPLFTLVATGILGAIDDYANIRGWGKTKGLGAKPKLFWLSAFALAGGLWFFFKLGYHDIHIPRFGDFELGWWYIPLFMFIIIAAANAVNITDGLDGLAGGLLVIAFAAYAVLAFVKGAPDLAIFLGILSGAMTAFLWFNIPPARFYMGDTGSLSLGATLGVVAMLTNGVFVLPLIGFIFVVETLSSIIQMAAKRWWGRKVFLVAPLHHHFEELGWPEYKVTMRFWIIGAIMAVIGLIIGLVGGGEGPLFPFLN